VYQAPAAVGLGRWRLPGCRRPRLLQGDFAALSRRAASFVDKILKVTKPGDIAFEQATKLELFVNLKAAKALGLTIPQSVLLGADEVIE